MAEAAAQGKGVGLVGVSAMAWVKELGVAMVSEWDEAMGVAKVSLWGAQLEGHLARNSEVELVSEWGGERAGQRATESAGGLGCRLG